LDMRCIALSASRMVEVSYDLATSVAPHELHATGTLNLLLSGPAVKGFLVVKFPRRRVDYR